MMFLANRPDWGMMVRVLGSPTVKRSKPFLSHPNTGEFVAQIRDKLADYHCWKSKEEMRPILN